MKCFSIILFFVYSNIAMATTRIDRDTQLYNFMLGKWHVVGGSCLSGSPVYWGGEPTHFSFEVEYLTNMQWSNTIKENGTIKRTAKGSYSVNEGHLYTRVTESCDFSNQTSSCESTSTPNSSTPTLLSIQGNELWILSNQGVLGGSCPAQDIFVMKLAR